jgi:hypothetical protein
MREGNIDLSPCITCLTQNIRKPRGGLSNHNFQSRIQTTRFQSRLEEATMEGIIPDHHVHCHYNHY